MMYMTTLIQTNCIRKNPKKMTAKTIRCTREYMYIVHRIMTFQILTRYRNSFYHPRYLTSVVTCGLYICCIGKHAPGRQVTSLYYPTDVNTKCRIPVYSHSSMTRILTSNGNILEKRQRISRKFNCFISTLI